MALSVHLHPPGESDHDGRPKAELVVEERPADERWSVANNERGVRTLVERPSRAAPALVALEATGGYELAAVAALVACMRKLLTILNAMTRTNTRWQEHPNTA